MRLAEKEIWLLLFGHNNRSFKYEDRLFQLLDYVEFSCRVLNIPFELVCRVLRIDDKKPDGLNDFKFSGCINLAQQEEVRGTIGTHVS